MITVGARVRLSHPEEGVKLGTVTQTQPMGESVMVEVRLDEDNRLMIVDSKLLEVVA